LKPDVCRRVVGRLPSPHIQDNWQKSPWFQQRGMAPPFSLRIRSGRILFRLIQRRREVYGGLSCEIVSDLCPNPFSHDWHVQPSCQRPNRLPPERRAFSSRRTRFLGANPNKSVSGCPRNPSNISFAPNPVNASVPQYFHVISTLGICLGRAPRRAQPT
jgi:hypothetical protein